MVPYRRDIFCSFVVALVRGESCREEIYRKISIYNNRVRQIEASYQGVLKCISTSKWSQTESHSKRRNDRRLMKTRGSFGKVRPKRAATSSSFVWTSSHTNLEDRGSLLRHTQHALLSWRQVLTRPTPISLQQRPGNHNHCLPPPRSSALVLV